uniref:ATP synthase complex subunit 8 n=1 Tax=Parapsyche difformis TaxID=2904886 RepID=A0A9E8RSI9_9NEOP|nr:ATP synthase F0 subunit 8 [Parapsyche difformis]UZZ43678.1 ATP synthase F0 subunit 8 [Parapsyche difformis]
MPQIMPLNWLLLMTWFLMIFFIMSTLLFYFYLPTPMTSSSPYHSLSKNTWKW